MESTKIRITAENQPRIVMPTVYATFGDLACAWTGAPVRKHVSVFLTGDASGVPVWSPPTC